MISCHDIDNIKSEYVLLVVMLATSSYFFIWGSIATVISTLIKLNKEWLILLPDQVLKFFYGMDLR